MVVILKNVLSTRAIYCGATVGGVSLHHIGMRTVGRARAPARERKVGIVSADAPILPRILQVLEDTLPPWFEDTLPP